MIGKPKLVFEDNFWTGERDTLKEILAYRKAAGYTVKEDLNKFWYSRLGPVIGRKVPKLLKEQVVIQLACFSAGKPTDYPAESTATDMLKRVWN